MLRNKLEKQRFCSLLRLQDIKSQQLSPTVKVIIGVSFLFVQLTIFLVFCTNILLLRMENCVQKVVGYSIFTACSLVICSTKIRCTDSSDCKIGFLRKENLA